MYRVLLVEDEQIVRLALKTLVDWVKYNFDIKFEASNGQQALDIIRKNSNIDIIITDINMPVMDGLTFIAEVHKLNKNPAIIVLSAYDDYNLVRKAFKLGIYDYILKTKMEPEKVLKLLQRVVDEREKLTHSTETEEYLQYNRKVFLRNLLEKNNYNNIDEQMIYYKCKIEKENILACFIWVDNYRKVKKRYENNSLKAFTDGMCEAISQTLTRMEIGEVIMTAEDSYVILLSFQTMSELRIYEKTEAIIKKIRHTLFNYMNVEITIGVSTNKTGYEKINLLYQEAYSNAKLRYILGKGKNIYPKDSAYIRQFDGERIIGKEEPLLKAIKNMDKEKVTYELNQLLSLIGSFKGDSVEETFGYYMELIFIIINYLNELEDDLNNIFEHNTNFFRIIQNFETRQEIHEWIHNLVNNFLEYLMQKKNTKTNSIIVKAQNYIENNYNKKLTLLEVSEQIGVSEGYFSLLFTQETGVSFKQYLTQARIKKAKELLSHTNMKIYEICYEVGYENVEHFSRVFKKIVGISPKQYKKRN